MKNKMKYISFFIVFGLIISIFLPVNASGLMNTLVDSMKEEQEAATNVANGDVITLVARIFSMLQFIGTGIALLVIMKLGISYMVTSVEEKAEIKKRAVPIVIGCLITIATVNILKIVQALVTGAFEDTANTLGEDVA